MTNDANNAAMPFFDDVPGVGKVFATERWLAARDAGDIARIDFGEPDPVFVRDERAELAAAWDAGAADGLAWDYNRETEFTTPNPYRSDA